MYLRVCQLHHSQDSWLAEVCHRFPISKKVWIALKNSRCEEAHTSLKQSLECLPHYKYVPTISAFAQLEYHVRSSFRGRLVFDQLVANYPERIDLLKLYLERNKVLLQNHKAELNAILTSVEGETEISFFQSKQDVLVGML